MDQLASPARYTLRKTEERTLSELFWPPEQGVGQKIRDRFFAEAHNRLSQPLYCIAFALIALAAVLRGRRQRGSVAIRLTIASLVAGFYLLPVIGAVGAIIVLMGYSPRAILQRMRVHSMAGSGA